MVRPLPQFPKVTGVAERSSRGPHPGTWVKMRCRGADKTSMNFGEIHSPLRVTLDDGPPLCRMLQCAQAGRGVPGSRAPPAVGVFWLLREASPGHRILTSRRSRAQSVTESGPAGTDAAQSLGSFQDCRLPAKGHRPTSTPPSRPVPVGVSLQVGLRWQPTCIASSDSQPSGIRSSG